MTLLEGTLGTILATRAELTPDQLAFTHSTDGAPPYARINYAELHSWVQGVAARIRGSVDAGAHVLLLIEPGLEFVAGLFACFQAGVVAISTAPPNPRRIHRTMPRLLRVCADAQVDAVLTTRAMYESSYAELSGQAELTGRPWVVVDDTATGGTGPLENDPTAVAFIQYTSGSTSAPRGVMLSQENLLANARVIEKGLRISPESRVFSWLPPSHDMGLFCGVVLPVRLGIPAAIMSPTGFLKRPHRWLEGISGFRATISGGPNFAYDLACFRTSPEQREGLDLSTWDVAFNGAERIRAQTVRDFTATFAPCGFRPESIYPCYGLAEATLMVSGPHARRAPTFVELQRSDLEAGVVKVGTDVSVNHTFVACGEVGEGHEVVIVDPATCRRCPPDRIGEIWISGPSVAPGYWRRLADTEERFGGRLADDDRRYLRTGDLGFLCDGEVVITGRLSDIIIVRGRNLYPQDIELAAEEAHPLIRRHCSAAFACTAASGQTAVAMVLEVEPTDDDELTQIIAAAHERVLKELDVQVHSIALVGPGNVPKTTSGKTQRKLCAKRFQSGELALFAIWDRT